MKNKEESCSCLDAIGRRPCGPLSGLAKIRHHGKPKLRLKRIETAGRYARLRFVTVRASDLHFTFEPRLLSSACISLGMLLKTVHASGKFCSISSPPPPPRLSLSLSPRDQIRENNHSRSTRKLEHPSKSSLNVATRSRSPGLPQLAHSG